MCALRAGFSVNLRPLPPHLASWLVLAHALEGRMADPALPSPFGELDLDYHFGLRPSCIASFCPRYISKRDMLRGSDELLGRSPLLGVIFTILMPEVPRDRSGSFWP